MDDDLLEQFLSETSESLLNLDAQLVELETNPNNPSLIDNIFRVMHTIKGTSGFLDLHRLGVIAHSTETLLDEFRNGAEVTSDAVTIILAAIDTIKEIISKLYENNGKEPKESDDILLDLLKGAAEDARKQMEGTASAFEVDEVETSDPKVSDKPEVKDEVKPEAPPAKIKGDKPEETAPVGSKGPQPQQSVRINVSLLDHLLDLVGELVLSRNQIQQISRDLANTDLTAPVQNLSHVASELQESVMKTRMQPIKGAWTAYPRIIRDLAQNLDKKIEVVMEGEDTEIDRQVLELIRDPLSHMVRNCADHALEGPEERLAAGKGDTGRITLKAFHEGGHIILQIIDDGRGISVDKVSKKALEKNLVSQEQLDGMTPNRIRSLIFQPGFSTAEKISAISGRGVGMDVVRTNIEQIGGTISVDSEEGRGTTFSIKIPLTLAIISAFVVGVGDQTFAVPQINVLEILNRNFENSAFSVDWVKGTPLLRLRGQTCPIICMSEVMGIERTKDTTILVCQVGSETFGVMVDSVLDTEEVVVKPLSRALADTTIYSGNTILGDGSVIMILDPNGLFSTFGVPPKVSEDELGGSDTPEVESDIVQMVLFQAGGTTAKAVHLSVVSRIDRVMTSRVKRVETKQGDTRNRYLVQYGDYLMPVVCPGSWDIDWEREEQKIIIFTDQDRSMGLAVDCIHKIAETDVVLDIESTVPGIIGSAVLDGEPTEIIDVSYFLDEALGSWFNAKASKAKPPESEIKVLIVDDSQFFRNVLSSMISSRGYDVVVAEDPEDALAKMRGNHRFDVLVSDIEMPKMTGLEFIRHIRSEGPSKDIHAVAISSHGTEKDRQRGLEAGFDEYLSKNDRESIFEFLSKALMKKGYEDDRD